MISNVFGHFVTWNLTHLYNPWGMYSLPFSSLSGSSVKQKISLSRLKTPNAPWDDISIRMILAFIAPPALLLLISQRNFINQNQRRSGNKSYRRLKYSWPIVIFVGFCFCRVLDGIISFKFGKSSHAALDMGDIFLLLFVKLVPNALETCTHFI